MILELTDIELKALQLCISMAQDEGLYKFWHEAETPEEAAALKACFPGLCEKIGLHDPARHTSGEMPLL